ncbi:glycyl-radical enzyme activating protein [Candidatus Bipolaricaulota bacterium]|nr:glycyl-radical enzyme activating protein [Candidatus Bipolaricaulota bacterium]
MLLTRIVRDSILDGPGCRYTIFVKGCNLRCEWCHNPETQQLGQEILTYEQFCIKCGLCISVLEEEDLSKNQLPIQIEDTTDPKYFKCAEICPSGALSFASKEYTTDWLLNDLLKYQVIYEQTGGGLTISGGEPLLSGDFSYDLCEKTRNSGIHTAIDTSGTLPWEVIARFLPVVDLWLYDIKHTDDESVKSALNIANFRKLAEQKTEIWVRIPIIPGYNDTKSIWEEMARLITSAGESVTRIDLLPFHPYADAKYIALRRDYKFSNAREEIETIAVQAKSVFSNYLPEERLAIGRTMVHG